MASVRSRKFQYKDLVAKADKTKDDPVVYEFGARSRRTFRERTPLYQDHRDA